MNTKNILASQSALVSSNHKLSAGKERTNRTMEFGQVLDQASNSAANGKETISKGAKDKSFPSGIKQKEVMQQSQSVRPERKDAAQEVSQAVDLEDEIENLPEVLEKIQQFLLDLLTGQLGIPKEQVESALDTLNLTPMDLLEPKNLMDFFTQVSGLDNPMELLTNQDLMNGLSNLKEMFDSGKLADSFGITEDQLKSLLEKHKMEQQKQFVGTDQKSADSAMKLADEFGTVKKNVSESVNTNQKQQETKEPESASTTDKALVNIIVEKESQANNEGSSFMNQQEQKKGDLYKDRNDRIDSNPSALVDNFTEKLAVKGTGEGLTMEQATSRLQTMKNIVNQVVEQIKITVKPAQTSMELQLNPESLGKINLSVASKNGQLTATITAQTQVAKEALESQVQTLRDNLSNQGLKVEAVEVTVSDFTFGNRQEGQMMQQNQSGNSEKQTKHRRKIDLSLFDDTDAAVSEEDLLAAKVLRDNGGSIDYTA